MLVPFSTHVCDREGKSWALVWSVARTPAGIRSSRSLADRAPTQSPAWLLLPDHQTDAREGSTSHWKLACSAATICPRFLR